MSDEKNDVLTIWIPLIGAFIMFVAVLIIYTNLDNELYAETGLRLFEPGFAVLLGIVLSVAMFLFFRSSGIKKAKKANEKNVENDLQFMRKQHTTKEKRVKGKRRSREEKQRSREEKQAYEGHEPEKA